MGKSFQIQCATVTGLLGALIFTLSSIPGVNVEAQVGSISLSSTCNVHRLLSDENLELGKEVSCPIEKEINGKKVTGQVVARHVKYTPPRLLGQTVAPVERDVVQLVVNTAVNCKLCQNGQFAVTKSLDDDAVEIPVERLGDLQKKIDELFGKEAATTIANANREQTRLQDVMDCKRGQDGEVVPERERLDCQMTQFSTIVDERQRNDYYDRNLKSGLETALASPDGDLRKKAQGMVNYISQNSSNNGYLNSSAAALEKYGKAHDLGYELANSPNMDVRTRALKSQQLMNMAAQLKAQGKDMNPALVEALNSFNEYNTYRSDMGRYQSDMDRLLNQYCSYLGVNNCNTTNNGQLANGVRPYGTGRSSYQGTSTPVTSYPNGPAVANPGALNGRPGVQQQQPLRPITQQQNGRGMPVIGQPVNGMR